MPKVKQTVTTTTVTTTTTVDENNAGVANTYILLDRSGSMSNKWQETLTSINAYVDELKKQGNTGYITVAAFDENFGTMDFHLVRNKVPVVSYGNITNDEITPRGMTPLFDAISRVVALAETANEPRTVIVVMTDGEENASREVKREAASSMIDRVRARGWQVLFMGAQFDAFNQAGSVGVSHQHTINIQQGGYAGALRAMAAHTHNYSVGKEQNIMFTDSDRLLAQGQGTYDPNKITALGKSVDKNA